MTAPVCSTCNGYGEIDDPMQPVPASYEDRLMLGPPLTIPCPDCVPLVDDGEPRDRDTDGVSV